MKTVINQGVYSALLTPFNEDGSIRESAIKELVDFQIERGISGFYVNGSTGEGMVMSEEERMQVVEAVVKASAGRAQVIAHVGTTSTDSAVRMAQHAEKVGVDGISAVSPFYYKHDMNFVLDYFKSIALSTDLPFLVYNNSEGTVLSYDNILELYKIPNIVGLKYTVDNLEVLGKFKEFNPEKLVFMGHDAMMLHAVISRADGNIGAFPNAMPGGFAKVWKDFKAGNLTDAMNEQLRINHFITIMKQHMKTSVQAPLKAVMKAYGVDCGTALRRPAQGLDKATEEHLISALKKDGYFDIYK